ncbi:hypothetical protein HK102_002325, partial [Quaeritorhiza haematococci]
MDFEDSSHPKLGNPNRRKPPALTSDALITIFALQPSIPTLLSSRLVCRFWNAVQLQNDVAIWKHRVLALLPGPNPVTFLEEYSLDWQQYFGKRYEGGRWKALWRLWDAYERRLERLVMGLTEEVMNAQGFVSGNGVIVNEITSWVDYPAINASKEGEGEGGEGLSGGLECFAELRLEDQKPEAESNGKERKTERYRRIVGTWARDGTDPALVQVRRVGSRLFVAKPGGMWRERVGVVDLMPAGPSECSERLSNPSPAQDQDYGRGNFDVSKGKIVPHLGQGVATFTLDTAPPGIDPASIHLEGVEVHISGATTQPHYSLDSVDRTVHTPSYLCLNEYIDTNTNFSQLNSIWSADTGELIARFPIRFTFQCIGFYKDLMIALVAPGVVRAYKVNEIGDQGIENATCLWERTITLQAPININASSLFISGDCVATHIIDYHEDQNIFLFKITTGKSLGHIPKSAWTILPSSSMESDNPHSNSWDERSRNFMWTLKPNIQITPFHILLAVDITALSFPGNPPFACTTLITINRKTLQLEQQHDQQPVTCSSSCIALPWTWGIDLDEPSSESEFQVSDDGFV